MTLVRGEMEIKLRKPAMFISKTQCGVLKGGKRLALFFVMFYLKNYEYLERKQFKINFYKV
jgi:hypothetical protein